MSAAKTQRIEIETLRKGSGGKPVKICEEMLKVRRWLDQRGVEWFDLSDMFMTRTHVDIGNVKFSVINGVGSYGGITRGLNSGLLEVAKYGKQGGVRGFLTAEEVIKMFEEEIKNVRRA